MSAIAVWDKFPPGYLAQWLENSAWNKKPTQLYPFEGASTDWDAVLEKAIQFPETSRILLCEAIQQQSANFLSENQKQSLQWLSDSTTYTVTTGQQIHFDLGPAYVFYKIASAIELSKNLENQFPQHRVVPIFWMASEDHDFEEISQSKWFNQTWNWEFPHRNSGPVGRLPVASLLDWLNWIHNFYSNNPESASELEVVKKIFLEPNIQLAQAIQRWVLWIFKDTPLLVLNPDDKQLKSILIPTFQEEIRQGIVLQTVEPQNQRLKENGLEPEALARKCNLFYMLDELRERIEINHDKAWGVVSGKQWTVEELCKEVENYPERFSPNVLMRPLYQQHILPNVAYIAGPSEYKYWLQVPGLLTATNAIVPALILRKSGVFISPTQEKKLNKWGVSVWDLFALSESELRTTLLEKLGAKYTFEEAITQWNDSFQHILSSLYAWKSDQLKNIKQQGDKLLSDMKKAEKMEQEKAINSILSESEWSNFLQLKAQLGSLQNPQERSFRWMQQFLKNPEKFYRIIRAVGGVENNPKMHPMVDPTYTDLHYFKEPFWIILDR